MTRKVTNQNKSESSLKFGEQLDELARKISAKSDNDFSVGDKVDHEKYGSGIIVDYKNTNPAKIEEATSGLEVAKLLPGTNKIDGTIAVRSIEEHIYDNLQFHGISQCMNLDGLSSSIIRNCKFRN